MIYMQYRERTLEGTKWETYGASSRITKDFRRFAKELAENEFRHYEWRYVNDECEACTTLQVKS